ncbi:MAG TPA: class I SAM-dependent methyltransferase [archaeon]|nr:class I SAM-dependent methyltransferase [archaeon]
MKCIVCESKNVELMFFLENGPKYAQKLLVRPDPVAGCRVNISLYKCRDCDMVQINPDDLTHEEYFEDYLMSRSCTELYTRYDNELAEIFVNKFDLSGKSVLEAGCGDGYFAEQLQKRGARVAAIEPSATACRLAGERGVECFNVFVDNEIEKHVKEKFDAFVTKQVMDLLKDPNSFLRNLAKLLKPGAYGLIDVPSWTKTLFDKRYFDVLPDRVGYYTANTLVKILERNNFHVIEVFHGAENEYVGAYVYYEGRKNGLNQAFKDEFLGFRKKFSGLMEQMSAEGKTIGAWGAGAKGVTIFSFTGMDSGKIKYVIDKDPHKWDHYLPGSLLKVVSPDILKTEPTDALIITAAMFYREITRELMRDYGYKGDLILLSPEPHVLSSEEINKILKNQ